MRALWDSSPVASRLHRMRRAHELEIVRRRRTEMTAFRRWMVRPTHEEAVERLLGLRFVRPAHGAECATISHDMTHSPLIRTNVTLPADLLEQVDQLAGERGRSRYVAEAVAQRVRRDALGAAIRETAGAMVGQAGWMSPDEVIAYVDDLRRDDAG
jgi:predicted transcriptional regulator